MIKTIKRTDDGEIDFSTGKIQYLTGVEGLAQRHKTRLQTFKNEWAFDESLGIPYIGQVLGTKGVKVSVLKSLFVEELLKVEGTASITKFIADLDETTRKLTITYEGISDEGETFENSVDLGA